jgi:sensor domain CHASE-containing protein
MNAIPVTSPATVIETLQAGATDPLSKKKNAVAARQPIDTSQNEIPTKSSVANRAASAALAVPLVRATAKAIRLNFFMKTSLNCLVFYFSLYINHSDKR